MSTVASPGATSRGGGRGRCAYELLGRGGRAAALSGGSRGTLLECHVVPCRGPVDRAARALGRCGAQGRGGCASRLDRRREAGDEGPRRPAGGRASAAVP